MLFLSTRIHAAVAYVFNMYILYIAMTSRWLSVKAVFIMFAIFLMQLCLTLTSISVLFQHERVSCTLVSLSTRGPSKH